MIIKDTKNLEINQKIYRLTLNPDANFYMTEFIILEIIDENELICSYINHRGETDIARILAVYNINTFKLIFSENPSLDIEYFKKVKYIVLKYSLNYLSQTEEYAFTERKRNIFEKFSSVYPELFIF